MDALQSQSALFSTHCFVLLSVDNVAHVVIPRVNAPLIVSTMNRVGNAFLLKQHKCQVFTKVKGQVHISLYIHTHCTYFFMSLINPFYFGQREFVIIP